MGDRLSAMEESQKALAEEVRAVLRHMAPNAHEVEKNKDEQAEPDVEVNASKQGHSELQLDLDEAAVEDLLKLGAIEIPRLGERERTESE